MVDVAIVGFAQHTAAEEGGRVELEFLQPVIRAALGQTGLTNQDMGFTVSGSSDYLAGQAFSFVGALDACGPWPPLSESHVEMDGAWALYEAYIRLQHGDIDTALVYAFGKSSPGDLARVLALQTDPYTMAPLWPDADSLAAIQARTLLEANGFSERDIAEVVARSHRNAKDNPYAVISGDLDVDELLAAPRSHDPMRAHDRPVVTDGAAAIVLATGDRARELCDDPIWITGIDHRIETGQFGLRDLGVSSSTSLAGQQAGVADGTIDLAELHAPYAHQELILTQALGLSGDTVINSSGGALTSNPMMTAGLIRIGEAAERLRSTNATRAVAHATSGPALQQNLVCVLERTPATTGASA